MLAMLANSVELGLDTSKPTLTRFVCTVMGSSIRHFKTHSSACEEPPIFGAVRAEVGDEDVGVLDGFPPDGAPPGAVCVRRRRLLVCCACPATTTAASSRRCSAAAAISADATTPATVVAES
eukprot:3363152-Prymnesium_polylepis.1